MLILRVVLIAVAVLVALPFVVTPAYRWINPPSMLILSAQLAGQPVDQRWRPLDEISPALVRAVVTSEDDSFCRHWGIDVTAIAGSLQRARETGRPARGVSTISMQVAKNLFLWPKRSWLRKGLEAPLALWLDLTLPKARILEIYLNIAEWGPGLYGAEAGAQGRLKRTVARLDPGTAALMATSLPNPRLRDFSRPKPGHRALAARVQGRAGATDLTCLSGHLSRS